MEPLTIEVWSLPDCPKCEEAKAKLHVAGFNVIVRDLEAVQQAKERDVSVLTQVTMQGGAAPVLRIAGDNPDAFITPENLDGWLRQAKA